jgi:RNase H-fold protein (predicted Holliday junction resolvase)
VILGIDPGTRKCGWAVIGGIEEPAVELGIVPSDALVTTVLGLQRRYEFAEIALGRGTSAGDVGRRLREAGVSFVLVDERETTLQARKRYFAAHPPRGWRRLVPLGMLLPPCPIDDFAAQLIAERYLRSASRVQESQILGRM